jgi:hypothetical protein
VGSESAAEAQAALVAARDALRAILGGVDEYLATLRPVLGREIRQIFERELAAAEEAVRALERALQALSGEASGGTERR